MDTEFDEKQRSVRKWTKGLHRHYDKMDAIEEWHEKTRYQMSLPFVGARDILITVQADYIQALEMALSDALETLERKS
jgi:hypothetical protein